MPTMPLDVTRRANRFCEQRWLLDTVINRDPSGIRDAWATWPVPTDTIRRATSADCAT